MVNIKNRIVLGPMHFFVGRGDHTKHNTHTYTHAHTHAYTHTHTHTHIHTYAYTHIRTYTHIHTYTYTHTHHWPSRLPPAHPLHQWRRAIASLLLLTMLTPLDAVRQHRVNPRDRKLWAPANRAGAAEARRQQRRAKQGDAGGRCRGRG